jgi:phosphoglucosamine mutase
MMDLGNVLNFLFIKKKIKKIIIGYDTRVSRSYIIKIILKKLSSLDKIEILKTPTSTPNLQFISQKKKIFAIMITASHFAHNYNGFKFFLNGKKIDKKDELFIEKKLLNKITYFPKNSISKIKYVNYNYYTSFINKHFTKSKKNNILIDCANGGASGFINKIKIFKKIIIINKNINKKINDKCGSNFLQNNYKKTQFQKFDFCIAFDGDADRLQISEKNYGLIEVEKIALIFIKYFRTLNIIKSIVSTEISNPWLENQLKKYNIKIYKSKVGDRNVTNLSTKKNSFFAFENSGHFAFNKFMDGIFAACIFINIVNNKKEIIEKVLKKKINISKRIFAISSHNIIFMKRYIKKKMSSKNYVFRKSIWNEYHKLYIFYEKTENKKLKKLIRMIQQKSLKIKLKN